ncbi:MAG: 6-phosphogluconolactonase [Buchnera aphidicola (Brevicoryne brassicae)]|uniref:6-phosphogluconolactonase n=1 Tax=Buchnera aphidicola (Brevicoryne brassicae) TaxID=911343 RepID=A0AAJ5PUA2_9GAMM|nr:6-phosphogluconolactonase [Buchnera aphidicola]QCI19856.1 6-phosphogluconolactonase [Buchnera aphidicola (Brevicoryne brassicae)]WAI18676.1 MAG: 6-phosphogluconolactonase [Buchnera aphidicola (Brevicoryne brassicae)]
MKQVVYIVNSKSENIEIWNLSDHGSMNLLQKISTNGQIQPINIIKNNNLLYAGIRPDNKIITYSIEKNGYIEKKDESFIPGKPNYISFDKTNKFVFCSSYHSNCVSVSPLNKYGIPKNPIQIVYNIKGCHAARVNDKYNILFVMSLKEDSIYLYDLTNFGILKSTEQKLVKTKEKSGPRHIVFHPNQDFVYTINELNGTIDVWKIEKINNIVNIQNIQNVNILNKNVRSSEIYWSSDIHITSCGRFLYVSDRLFNIISLFHVNKNNTITFIKIYKTVEQPRSFCIDCSNSYLIVAGEKNNTCAIYSISKNTGELKILNIYNTSEGPSWILTYKLN